MDHHYHIILNPLAGKGQAIKYRLLIEEFFSQYDLPFTIHLTEKPGHAIKLAEQIGSEPEAVVIAAGGDGTCNEVINGLMKIVEKKSGETPPILSVLPIGRGNDFSYGTDFPKSIEQCLEIIKDGNIHNLDIGKVTGGMYPKGKYFGNGIGIGFDTIVGLEAAKMKYVRSGIAYALAAIKLLIKFPKLPFIKLSAKNKNVDFQPALISIMNGKRMGGSFYMAPDSCNQDGLLDLCASPQSTRLKMLRTMIKYIRGTQKTLPETVSMRKKSYIIDSPEGGMACHADGETICIDGKHLEVTCIPNALRIIKKGKHQ